MHQIILLTGKREAGKTHLCQRVVEGTRSRGYACAGVLSRPLIQDGEKVGIILVDVASREERLLATADQVPGEVRWGRYSFVSSTLTWGAELLFRATPCDLLVVDELGPLELELGQGLVKCLDVLAEGEFALALVVVRPTLVDEVRRRLQGEGVDVLEVTLENRDRLPGEVLSLLEAERE
jgi:nucleoside-triphosphatase THEP1